MLECPIPDFSNTRGNIDVRQGVAFHERIPANMGHTIRDMDPGDGSAPAKSIGLYCLDAFGDGNLAFEILLAIDKFLPVNFASWWNVHKR